MRKSGASSADMAGLAGSVEYLESNADTRARFQSAFAELLSEMDSVPLFSEAGIPSDHSFTSEIGQRISARVLPSAREQSDTAKLVVTLYPNAKSVERFMASPPELFQRLLAVLAAPDGHDVAGRQRLDLQEALRLLASRVSALGLKPEVRARSSISGISESPFYQVTSATEDVIRAADSEASTYAPWRAGGDIIHRCRTEMVQVHQHMENAGVSVELIFDMRKISACLVRMEAIVDVLAAETRDRQSPGGSRAARPADGRPTHRSQLALPAPREPQPDRPQDGGADRPQRRALHRRTTARNTGTCGLPPWEVACSPLSPPPSRSASTTLTCRPLSRALPPERTTQSVSCSCRSSAWCWPPSSRRQPLPRSLESFAKTAVSSAKTSSTDFVSRITSTQLAAALGNVFAVGIGALFFERLWMLVFSESYLAHETATHVYETLNPTVVGHSPVRHRNRRHPLDGSAGRRLVRELRRVLPPHRRCGAASARPEGWPGPDEEGVPRLAAQPWRLEHFANRWELSRPSPPSISCDDRFLVSSLCHRLRKHLHLSSPSAVPLTHAPRLRASGENRLARGGVISDGRRSPSAIPPYQTTASPRDQFRRLHARREARVHALRRRR